MNTKVMIDIGIEASQHEKTAWMLRSLLEECVRGMHWVVI